MSTPPTSQLIDTAAIVIESIWPPLPGSSECPQKQKGLPLRTFIQETLKRSRSSYSTLQTALFYLYKIRNKVPCAYLKRRQDQLFAQQLTMPSPYTAAGLATPPASPYHQQNLAEFPNVQGSDYFSARKMDSKPSLPSPLSSNCSMASASPASVSGYSPCSSASPSSTSSSPDSSSASPCPTSSSASSATSATAGSTTSASSSSQSNRIIYCGRRTFLAALMVASKYLQDRNYSNKAWAKISGLSIKEINTNELIFLKLIDYSLFVSHETFMRWTALLVAHGPDATRKFMQTADAVHANAFAARVMSAPPMVLNGGLIRYAANASSRSDIVASAPSPAASISEDDMAADPCENLETATSSRNAKVARMNTYPSIIQSSGHVVHV
ncbi:hypothetical protein BGX24_007512 [Mortierella sp. AD032]|nr:hypothetical protein BGX24_007512 [Mortierella sp. AD032]